MHYGLTRYLADKTGKWSPEQAEQIACTNQDLDEKRNTAATWLVVHDIWFGNDGERQAAFETIWRHHFPSANGKPGKPETREVKPDGSIAKSLRKELSPRQRVEKAKTEKNLGEMGRALHALMDSWSHQGVPDIPIHWIEFRPTHSWGHPWIRGGSLSHDADLSYMSFNSKPDQALEAARQTFFLLGGSSSQWQALSKDIELFIAADTKDKKISWFKSNGYEPFDVTKTCNGNSAFSGAYVASVNLPIGAQTLHGGVDPASNISATAPKPPVFVQTAGTSSCTEADHDPSDSALRNAIESLKDRWFFQQDVGEVLEAVDLDGIRDQITEWKIDADARDWARRFLPLWLVADHGLINQKGHGMPTTDGFRDLPVVPQKDGPYRAFQYPDRESIAFAQPRLIAEEARNDLPYLKGYAFSVPVQIRRLRHDAIDLIFGCRKGRWKVVRFSWVAM